MSDEEPVEGVEAWSKLRGGMRRSYALSGAGLVLTLLSVQYLWPQVLTWIGIALVLVGIARGTLVALGCPGCKKSPYGQGPHCVGCGGPWTKDPTDLLTVLAGVGAGLAIFLPLKLFGPQLEEPLSNLADRTGIDPFALAYGGLGALLLVVVVLLLLLPKWIRRGRSFGCAGECAKENLNAPAFCSKCGIRLVAGT